MTKSNRTIASTIGLSLLIGGGIIALHAQPAAAHSQAACKIEALYACQDMQGKHEICVQYATQLCANHSHSLPGAGFSSNPGKPRSSLLAPTAGGGSAGFNRGLVGPGVRMGGMSRVR